MANVLKFRPNVHRSTNLIPDYQKAATHEFKLTHDELIMIKTMRELPQIDRQRVMTYAKGTVDTYRLLAK